MKFDAVDKNNNGTIEEQEWAEMQVEFERKRLEDEDAKRDSQRKMAWFSLVGMLVYPSGVFLSSLIGLDSAAELLASMANIYYVSIAALVGAYESFQSSEYYVWDNLLFQDVRSDNNYAGGDNPEIFQIDFLEVTPTHTRLFTHWSNIYNAISKANLVIERVELITDVTLTEERRMQIRGEALFLRAYHYFTLVKLFGGVPLITNTIISLNPEDVNIPRASVAEVYNQIILDLEAASTLLPEVYGNDASVNKARATSGAANALAAKVIMQSPNPDYNKALEHITAVENSAADYRLIDYNQLFDGNTRASLLCRRFHAGPGRHCRE